MCCWHEVGSVIYWLLYCYPSIECVTYFILMTD